MFTQSEKSMARALVALPAVPRPFGQEQCQVCGALGGAAELRTAAAHKDECAVVTALSITEMQQEDLVTPEQLEAQHDAAWAKAAETGQPVGG